jgi:hypothetical protein
MSPGLDAAPRPMIILTPSSLFKLKPSDRHVQSGFLAQLAMSDPHGAGGGCEIAETASFSCHQEALS